MTKDFKVTLIESIIYIILGALFFIPQVNFLQIILCVIGAAVLIFGIYLLVKGIIDNTPARNGLIIGGTILTIIGILFVTLVWFVFAVIAVMVGIFFIAASVVGLFSIIKDSNASLANRIVNLLINVCYLAIGILLIVNCSNSFQIVSYIIGGVLILDGIMNIIITVFIIRESKKNIVTADSSKNVVNDDDPIVIDVDVTNDQD